MSAVIEAPVEFFESLGTLRFPPKADARLQDLMDRNNDDLLTVSERGELETLVELSETMSLFRAQALNYLRHSPS